MATAKKPSAAQIAARKRFAEMARSGVFAKRAKNPAKKRTAKAISRPSQASGKTPTKRLIDRRKRTAKAPPGFFANPKTRSEFVTRFSVRESGAIGPDAIAWFTRKAQAVQYAQALADSTGASYVVGKASLPKSEAP